ncbi:MAG: thioredoxin family protein [Chitinispirillaceae bacterium]
MSRTNLILTFTISSVLLMFFLSDIFKKRDLITEINSEEQFRIVIEESGPELIALEVYTEWSIPSRVLLPVLKQIARNHQESVTIYRLNLDNFPQLVPLFESSRIPFVVFFKNQKAVHALTGVQPKSAYERIINMYKNTSDGQTDPPSEEITPGGLIMTRKGEIFPPYRPTRPPIHLPSDRLRIRLIRFGLNRTEFPRTILT